MGNEWLGAHCIVPWTEEDCPAVACPVCLAHWADVDAAVLVVIEDSNRLMALQDQKRGRTSR